MDNIIELSGRDIKKLKDINYIDYDDILNYKNKLYTVIDVFRNDDGSVISLQLKLVN